MPFRIGSSIPPRIWQFGLELMDVAVPIEQFMPALEDLLTLTAEHRGLANVLVHPDPFGNSTAAEYLDFYRAVVALISARPDCWVATYGAVADAMSLYESRVAGTSG